MLHGLFALDGKANVIMALEPNQRFQAVTFAESIDETVAVLVAAARQVSGDAGVQDPVLAVGHHVNEGPRHSES